MIEEGVQFAEHPHSFCKVEALRSFAYVRSPERNTRNIGNIENIENIGNIGNIGNGENIENIRNMGNTLFRCSFVLLFRHTLVRYGAKISIIESQSVCISESLNLFIKYISTRSGYATHWAHQWYTSYYLIFILRCIYRYILI